MFNDQFVRQHRLSALANGVLIGMGLFFILFGVLIGVVSMAAGIGLEVWQRRRIPKGPGGLSSGE